MAARRTKTARPERRFFVEGVRREPVDTRKLAKALLAMVLAEQQRITETDASHEESAG
ncbi:hypothetical protein [Streptomyces luteolifulvus]|uniref:hypothetical protein n=1 Tax=Streptomyces luteolifulvus TaxID=2615112 RepID=UPI0017848E01|nr:hypothetical protein [Streptomyces luteolifulvus]